MADTPNFFPAILPTPDNLSAQRQARFDAQSEGQDFWVKAAGQSGLDFRRGMIARGVGLTGEDRRAFNTQEIMGKAQQMLAESVRNGDIDPLTAQEQAVRSAMADFAALGDYQSAQALLPGLNQILTYKGELGKLRSETNENDSTAFNQAAQGQSTLAKTPSEILDKNSSAFRSVQAGNLDIERQDSERAAQALRYAQASLANRKDPNLRSGGRSGTDPDLPSSAQRDKIRTQGSNVLNTFDRMADLTTFMDKAPIVASAGGQGLNVASQYLAGARNVFSSSGASVGGFNSLSARPEDGANGMSPRDIVGQNRAKVAQAAARLGFKDITSFESLVIDAAYALARSNDPGGRLSNNDFQFALQSLGAVQDATSAKKAFRAIAQRAKTNYDNMKRTYKPDKWKDMFGDMDEEVNSSFARFTDQAGQADVQRVQDADAAKKVGTKSIEQLRSEYVK